MKRRPTDDEVEMKFIQFILNKRSELKITPRKCQAVSLNEAAQLCNIGVIGSTVTDLITLQEQGDKRDLQDFLDKHMPKILAFCMVVGVIILGIYILSKQGL